MIKYLFCINTGRSGSNYLGNMLKHCSGVYSTHEPEPVLNGKPMRNYLLGKPDQMKKLIPLKIDQIQSHLKDAQVYFESSHMFIKGFGWLLPEHIPHEEIGVVILKRDAIKIRDSFFRIRTSPLNKLGRQWLMPIGMKNSICKPKSNYLKEIAWLYFLESKLNKSLFKINKSQSIENAEKEALEWYIKETHAQAEEFKKTFPNITYFETTTEKLNDVKEYENIFRAFNLNFEPESSFFEKLGVRTNLKAST